jgi:hypothetical protein
MSIIPDTSVLLYYFYGNSSQKKKISKKFIEFKNNILINPILKTEIGRTIFLTFFKIKQEILKYINLNKENIRFDDLWIDFNQKLQKKRDSHLRNRCYTIITILRNNIDKIPVKESDPNYDLKQIHRIESAIDWVINDLLKFQSEIQNWDLIESFNCPRSDWEIIYNENLFQYELMLNNSCAKSICKEREFKLKDFTNKYQIIFNKILKDVKKFCKENGLYLDERLYRTIRKLLDIYDGKDKFDFHTWYCLNLGDFLISELLIESNNYIYTYNVNDFKLILNYLEIDKERIIPFSQ